MSNAIAKMQYKKHYVTVKMVGNEITIDAPTIRSRNWARKQLKKVAEKYEIELTRENNIYFVEYCQMKNNMFFVNYYQIEYARKKIFPALEKCYVIRSKRQMKRAMRK